MRNLRKSLKLGAIYNGDATAEQRVIITSTAKLESEFVAGGVEALRRSLRTWDLLLQDYTRLTVSRLLKVMSLEMLGGQQSKNKTLIVGTLSELSGKVKKLPLCTCVKSLALTTALQQGDWHADGA